MPGPKPVLGFALAQRMPDLDRFGEPPQLVSAEIGELEQAGHQAMGVGGHDHRAGLRQRLQPGGQVRRLADHAVPFFVRAADHHEAGRDPDPGLERPTGIRLDPGDRTDQLEAGQDRALGIILVRPRVAEVDQETIAQEAGDLAVKAPDHPRCQILIGADHLAHVLGVEQRGELGRAHQIAEHHRQLPALGRTRDDVLDALDGRGGRRRGRRVLGQGGAAVAAVPVARRILAAAGGAARSQGRPTVTAESLALRIDRPASQTRHDRLARLDCDQTT